MPATVVFDTNILFSATAWRGNPFQCVELARTGQIHAVCCAEIFDELAEKVEINLHFSKDQVADTLADYLAFLSLASIPHTLDAVPCDPEDNAVLVCAETGQAQFITTGDLDLLTLGTFHGIEILRAAEFMRRWQAGQVQS